MIQARDTARQATMLKDEVILHGPQGRIIAKTTNQHKLVEL